MIESIYGECLVVEKYILLFCFTAVVMFVVFERDFSLVQKRVALAGIAILAVALFFLGWGSLFFRDLNAYFNIDSRVGWVSVNCGALLLMFVNSRKK